MSRFGGRYTYSQVPTDENMGKKGRVGKIGGRRRKWSVGDRVRIKHEKLAGTITRIVARGYVAIDWDDDRKGYACTQELRLNEDQYDGK